MAEFCLDCLREMDGRNYDEADFVLSDDLDLCEGCGQWKHVVVAWRQHFIFEDLWLFLKQLIAFLCSKCVKK